jgi:Amt family ammonium transporter
MKKLGLSILFAAICISRSWAGDEPPTIESNKNLIELVQSHADYVWTLVAAALVFFMQAGFAMVESGFTRAKNAVNIMMKNLMDFSMGSLAFWAIGFGIMFGGTSTGWFGTTGFFLSDFKSAVIPGCWPSGCSRWYSAQPRQPLFPGPWPKATKFAGYLIIQAVLSAIIYPVFGSWAWGSLFKGSGWLEGLGFIDFAGSTVVHSVGGWAALAGAIVLGPRIGKYTKGWGKIKPILGHNMPLAALGVFILWLGWFGFNPGSTTAANKDIAMIFVNTNLAAAAGAVLAMITSWIKFGKPEVGMSLNGALAGLVAITAPCATVSPL